MDNKTVREISTGCIENCNIDRQKTLKKDHVNIIDKKQPFIHKYQTDINKYVFDVNSCNIIKLSPIVWDIVEWCNAPIEEVVDRFETKYKVEDIEQAYEEICKAKNNSHVFSSHRPEIVIPYSKEDVKHMIEHEREQLILNITERCNFACTYCHFTQDTEIWRNHSDRMMDWNIAKTAIDDFLEHCKSVNDTKRQKINKKKTEKEDTREIYNPPAITFYGGEPLIMFDLIKKCVKYTRQKTKGKKMSFGMSTNGSLLTEEVADYLISEGFHIRVSLDGPKAIHDAKRRTTTGAPTWEIVVRNLRRLFQKHPDYRIMLGPVISPETDAVEVSRFFSECDWIPDNTGVMASLENEPDMGYQQRVSRKEIHFKGYSELYKKFLARHVNGKGAGLMWGQIIPEKCRMEWSLFQARFLWLHRRPKACPEHPEKSILPDTYAAFPTCIPGARRIFVSTNGDYYTCERVPDCKDEKLGSIYEGINLDRVYSLVERFVNSTKDMCGDCWCLLFCQVGCFANIRDNNGFSEDEKRHNCIGTRDRIDSYIRDYCSTLEKNPHSFDYMNEVTVS